MDNVLPGERLLVYNPRGTLCGAVDLKEDGSFAELLHVYLDDAGSKEKDEGLRPGDALTFMVGDRPVYPIGGEDLVFNGRWNTISKLELGG